MSLLLLFFFASAQVYQATGEHSVYLAQPAAYEFYSAAVPSIENETSKGNADDFIDRLLADFGSDDNLMAFLRPFIISDVLFDLGSVRNVTIHGLPSLSRTGAAIVTFKGEKLLIDLSLGVSEVLASAKYSLRYGVRLSGQMNALVKKFSVNLRLAMVGTSVKLERFSVGDLAFSLTDLTGTSALNRVNRFLINRFVKGFGRTVRSQMETIARKNINEALSSLDLRRSLARTLAKIGQ